jgi:Leucine-rich repeat (LRR) protein
MILVPKEEEILDQIQNEINREIPIVDGLKINSLGIEIHRNHIIGLSLYNQNLFSLPVAISNLKYLRKLDLSSNKISNLGIFENRFQFLEYLNLTNNNLSNFPELKGFQALRTLYIAQNSFDILPNTISLLSRLQYLNLGINNLTKLPEEITDLKRLTMLSIYENQLQSLPNNFEKFKKLKSLIISKNDIGEIPESIGYIDSLETFILNGNKIKKLPNSICNLQSLVSLDISANRIQNLPIDFYKLTNLRFLTLNNNPWNREFTSIIEKGNNIAEINTYCRKLRNAHKTWNPTLLIEKMQNNQPPDDVDRTYPDICKFAGILEEECMKYENSASKEVLRLINERCSIKMGNTQFQIKL